jgi:enterochelin esterase-like enzyme
MRRRRVVVAIVFAVIAMVAFASGTAVGLASKPARRTGNWSARSAADTPARTVALSCPSPALGGTLPALVYLPAGYSVDADRYPVVYFLHGLPAEPSSYKENAFVAAALVTARQRAIVVAPQGARSADSDREYLDWSATEDWPLAITRDLPRCVDARFHTIAGRYGRALIGLSAGGYGAFNIGLRNLAWFGAVESWSGYFVATDPAGDRDLDLGSATANADARVPTGSELEREVATWPALIDFYVGSGDSRFLSVNRSFDAALTQSRVPHRFDVYPGGHSGALWRREAPPWLKLALQFLAGGARHQAQPTAAAR